MRDKSCACGAAGTVGTGCGGSAGTLGAVGSGFTGTTTGSDGGATGSSVGGGASAGAEGAATGSGGGAIASAVGSSGGVEIGSVEFMRTSVGLLRGRERGARERCERKMAEPGRRFDRPWVKTSGIAVCATGIRSRGKVRRGAKRLAEP